MVMLEFLIVIFKNLRKIVFISLCTGLVLFLLATILPKEYKSTSIAVISVGSNGGGMGLSSMISDLSVPSFLKSSFGGSGEQLNIAQTILESDNIKYNIINLYKYDSIYTRGYPKKKKPRELLLKKFNKYFSVEINDQDAIIVKMQDRSPERAAAVAIYAIEKADSILNSLATSNAQKRAEFFEIQILKQKERLNASEDAIREYQEANKVALPQEQAEATMEASVEIDTKVITAEINLNILRQKFQENHPKVIEATEYLSQLRKKRNQMVYNAPDNVLFPLSNLPRTMVELGRLQRDFVIQQAVYKTILPELESAKLEQFKNIPTLQFIEKATPAERRSYPPRFVWVMLGLSLGVCCSVFWICVKNLHAYLKINDPKQAKLISELIRNFFSNFKF